MQCATAQVSSAARPELISDGYTYPLKGRSLTIAAGLSSHKRLQCWTGFLSQTTASAVHSDVLSVCFPAFCSIADRAPGRSCLSLSMNSQSCGAGLGTCKGRMNSDLRSSAP